MSAVGRGQRRDDGEYGLEPGGARRRGPTRPDAVVRGQRSTSHVTRESDEPVATAHGGGRAHMNLVRTSARKLVFLYVAAALFGIRPAEYTGLVKPYVARAPLSLTVRVTPLTASRTT